MVAVQLNIIKGPNCVIVSNKVRSRSLHNVELDVFKKALGVLMALYSLWFLFILIVAEVDANSKAQLMFGSNLAFELLDDFEVWHPVINRNVKPGINSVNVLSSVVEQPGLGVYVLSKLLLVNHQLGNRVMVVALDVRGLWKLRFLCGGSCAFRCCSCRLSRSGGLFSCLSCSGGLFFCFSCGVAFFFRLSLISGFSFIFLSRRLSRIFCFSWCRCGSSILSFISSRVAGSSIRGTVVGFTTVLR